MEKIDTVKSYWAAEGRKDLDAVLAHFAEDAEFVSPTMRLEGCEKIAEFYRGMIDNFRSIEVTPTNWLEQGDSIAVQYDCRLVRNSGEERKARGFNLFVFRGERFCRLHCYFNPADF